MGHSLSALVAFLFGFRERVTRKPYAIAGITLVSVKYLVDAAIIWSATGILWKPWDYVALPAFTDVRSPNPITGHALFALLLWTVPFLWIGTSMTIRRTVDANRSPWIGILFFVPIVNYVVMLALCFAPSVPNNRWSDVTIARADQHRARSAVFGALTGVLVGVLGVLFNVYVEGSYGPALFFATPVGLGIATAFVFNRHGAQGARATDSVVFLAVLIVGGVLISFALEGVLCLIMAIPFALPLAILGGMIGRKLALHGGSNLKGAMLSVLIIPASTTVDHFRAKTEVEPTYLASTTVIVDAPREVVWQHVVQFGEIQGALELPFRLGLAYPQRARIDGRGVGAIRRCEFSTGAFVEPITVWDEPARLAFDVTAQPAPLQEWSPYQKVYAPHLNGYFRSVRGEFRLTALPNGRTQLEGRTWYQLDVHPRGYWRLISEAIVSRIHRRVLDQVSRESAVAAVNLHHAERFATP